MVAIYTYFAQSDEQKSAGFLSTKDMAMFLSLSVEYSKKHFDKVKLVTDIAGAELLVGKYQIPFDVIDTSLEGLKIHKDLWAYAKLVSYSLQTEPFTHIDIDCALFQKIPTKISQAKLFFQNKELFSEQRNYVPIINGMSKTTVSYFLKRQKINYAFNCGVVGVNDLELVKKWKEMADELIFNPANANFWENCVNKGSMNYIFEQFFIACICANDNVKDVGFLIEDFSYEHLSPKFKMVHLWGASKRCKEDMDGAKDKLKIEFPKIFSRIDKIEPDESHLFKEIHENGTIKFKALLKKTLRDKKIKSVVYLGWDDIHSKYINIDGRKIDFLYTSATKHVFPECDLLIIKNCLPKWSGEEYAEFFSKKIPSKYIMDGKSVTKILARV